MSRFRLAINRCLQGKQPQNSSRMSLDTCNSWLNNNEAQINTVCCLLSLALQAWKHLQLESIVQLQQRKESPGQHGYICS